MQLSEPFKLNGKGYALLQKFILLRIENDITSEICTLEALKNKNQDILQKSGFINSINRMHNEHSIIKVQNIINQKEAWKEKWKKINILTIDATLIQTPIQEIINSFKETVIGRIQLYLILQEVVHTPIYTPIEPLDLPMGNEINFEDSIIDISNLCGLSSLGKQIIDDTNSFFKEIKRENTNILKWGLYGLVGVTTLISIIAMPLIAPAIGGLMGLSGAAATASGLAILGGGSVAAGGLGMAGGMTVLVGGSGILGAIAGGAAGKLIGQLPQEALALSIVKVINLITYLNSNKNPDHSKTEEVLIQAKSLLLEFKYETEKELLFNGIDRDKKDSIKIIEMMNIGFKRII